MLATEYLDVSSQNYILTKVKATGLARCNSFLSVETVVENLRVAKASLLSTKAGGEVAEPRSASTIRAA